METQRRHAETWFARLSNEVYVGALVLTGVAVVGGIVAGAIELVLELSDWVAMAD